MSDYEIGHGRPPKQYQFGQPNGNKPGLTSEARRMQIENAEKSLRITEMLLDGMVDVISNASPEDRMAMIDAAKNALLKDAQNRGLGMPTQQVDQTSSDGSMSPSKIVINGVKPKASE